MNSSEHQPVKSAAPNVQAPHFAERRISLASWIAANYSEGDAPTANTVRRWVRDKRILPAPRKEGRSYYFSPTARYNDTPGSA